MKQKSIIFYSILIAGTCLLLSCSDAGKDKNGEKAGSQASSETGTEKGSGNYTKEQIALGEHLVMIAGCHDCHTPKKMTEKGPELDFSLALSGHPAQMPPPDINRKEVEQKGLAVSQTLTSWVGPWGISYAANLTSDKTGIGDWTEENFFIAIREGKFKGVREGRTLLPPMPWEVIKHMTDEELRAVFAYLKSTKPIANNVPAAQPPLSAGTPPQPAEAVSR